MKMILCDINLFSMGQYVYITTEDGQMDKQFTKTLDELPSFVADYCQHDDIKLVKMLDKAGYAKRILIPAIKEYGLKNYNNFDVEFEVESK